MSDAHACKDESAIYTLSLQELMAIPVNDLGSLTQVSRAKVPAGSTRICPDDIQATGARSLMELLEITVPGLQLIRHHWELPHLGLRGVISDKEDKVMIRVNGRVMNERIGRGAITERDFPLMNDIKHIDVIRGAGSSMFGLGAVAMVIDITTYDAKSNPGNSVSFRSGSGMKFHATDVNFSRQSLNGLGVYFNAEWADVIGADDTDAPLIFGADATSLNTGQQISRGEPFPTNTRDGEGFNGKPFLKTHLNVDYNDIRFWTRFTRGGRNEAAYLGLLALPPEGEENVDREYSSNIGYDQFTATVEKLQTLNDRLNLDLMLSFDRTEVTKIEPFADVEPDSYDETEVFLRAVAQWDASDASDLAFGTEYSAETYRRRGTWDVTTSSLLGEWKWQPAEKVLTFAGGRLDKNTYSDLLFSPRLSLVYSQNNHTNWKLLMTRSQRMDFGKDNRRAAIAGDRQSDAESLDSVEARYEHRTENSMLGLGVYHIDLDVLGWDQITRRHTLLGNQRQWGLEAEMEHHFDKHQLKWSAAYSKLLNFDLDSAYTAITAAPFGYGNDLADWAKYSTKFQYIYRKDNRTTLSSSLRVFWDYAGSEDFRDKHLDDGDLIVSEGWEKGYGEQIYLNFGVQHKLKRGISLSANLYNVLGWIDKDLNKRAYRGSQGDYRSEAASISVGIRSDF